MAELRVEMIPGTGQGQHLELLVCLPTRPSQDTSASMPPVLFIHGAFCSAHDFQFFLPHFAAEGFPAYALSLRGHGKSWTPAGWRFQLMTMDQHISDIKTVLQLMGDRHKSDGQRPIVCGHSFGGGYLQYLLSQESKTRKVDDGGPGLVSGLVLLGSAPIWGGAKQIMSNWEHVETHGQGYAYPWSPRSQLETAQQVREAFFRPETDGETIELWRKTCRTEKEAIRTGLAAFWQFGQPAEILAAVEGVGTAEERRKVLLVAAAEDALVTPDMVKQNADRYEAESQENEAAVSHVTIPESGHHLMMDTHWKQCADEIIAWLA